MGLKNKDRPSVRAGTVEFIVILVSLVWAVNFIAIVFNTKYEIPSGVQVVMTMVVGGLLGYRFIRDGNGSKDGS